MLTIPNIRTSVENKSVLVLDEHAKNSNFKRDVRGRLIAYTGGFTVVFPYKAYDGKTWAFRCWHSSINYTQKRYNIISEAIRKAHLDFLCEFEYIEKGINVNGNIYPTTRMRWIDGVTIKDYICQNKQSKERLRALADNFLKMTRTLHSQSLAHGDLQHGNILVDNDHQLHLVDYDSFYCPELNGEADSITGLPDYQHPARKNNKTVSEKLDYFSELIIYLSILAISEKTSLIDKYKVKDSDRLLFSKEDYEDITNSESYKDIQSLGESFQEILDVLAGYLKHNDINELIPFEFFLLEKKVTFSASTTKVVRNTQTVVLEWNVPFEADVYLKQTGESGEQKYENKGYISKNLVEDSTFELLVKTVNDYIIKKDISIKVFDECIIDFSADKYYVFPTIPVKLTWGVKHAKRVWIDSDEVETKGTKIIEPQKATTIILTAEDEFGRKKKSLDINMLPIPQVKTILVPTPQIANKFSITIKQPKYNVGVSFPNIEFDIVKTEPPKVPSFKEMGLNIEFPPLPKSGLMNLIRKLLNR